jgi:hypothetical protein
VSEGFEDFLFDPAGVAKNRDVSGNIEKVMKEKFLDRAYKKFQDHIEKLPIDPLNGSSAVQSPERSKSQENDLNDEMCTINVEGVPRTIYLNSKLSQRTLAKVRD